MTPQHLTLLLLLPAFVAGMALQWHCHRRAYRARIAGLHSLRRPRRIAPAAAAPVLDFQSRPKLVPHFRAPHITEYEDRLFLVEFTDRHGVPLQAYVHADTLADAVAAFRAQTGIADFMVAGSRFIAA